MSIDELYCDPDEDELEEDEYETLDDPDYDMAELEPEVLGREADFIYDPIRDRSFGNE